MGAERAEAQPQGDPGWSAEDLHLHPAVESFQYEHFEEDPEPGRSAGMTVLGVLLLLLGIAWIGVVA